MAKRSAAAVWEYFTMFQDRLEITKCSICCQIIRRGSPSATSKNLSAKSLWGNLKSKHKNKHSVAEKERSKETERKRKFLKSKKKNLNFHIFCLQFFLLFD